MLINLEILQNLLQLNNILIITTIKAQCQQLNRKKKFWYEVSSFFDIIEPKDKLIEKLYSENKQLHREIESQVNVIDEAERYQKIHLILYITIENKN